MSDILFIRHGETDMAGTFCGHSDPPISSRGLMQIAGMIERLNTELLEAIYTSDLHRAVITAEALAAKSLIPVMTKSALREIHFGDWEGLTWTEIEQRDPVYARRWAEAFPTLPAPGGETYAAFEHRVLDEVEHFLLMSERKHIAIVTHGGVMRVVLRRILGYSEEQAWELQKLYCSSFVCAARVSSQAVSQ